MDLESHPADPYKPATEKIGATVDFYDAHVLYCTGPGSHQTWPKHVSTVDKYYAELRKSLSSRKKSMKHIVKLSLCDAENTATEPDNFDLLVIKGGPEPIFSRITINSSNLESLWDYIDNGHIGSLHAKPLSSTFVILVCCHGQKHSRSGTLGLSIATEFEEQVKQGRSNASVYKTTHIGKNEFTADVICYPTGDWYGNVKESVHVERILSALTSCHPEPYLILHDLWRGAMGKTKDEQIRLSPNARVVDRAASHNKPVKVLTLRSKMGNPLANFGYGPFEPFLNEFLTYLAGVLLILSLFTYY